MIKSMTAFARQSIEQEWGTGAWEIRSVNSRFLETNFRLPENLRYLEFKIREKLRKSLTRGKVDCNLKLEMSPTACNQLSIDESLVASLLDSHKAVQKLADIEQQPNLTRILYWPGVISKPQVDASVLEQNLLQSLEHAIEQLITMRQLEGESITEMIAQRLNGVTEQVSTVRQEMPAIIAWQKDKILKRFEEIKLEFETTRIEQEMVMIAQKIDVDEELDRLETHVAEVARLMKKGGSIGRRLDFLMQELNREANTLGSKSINAKTTNASVELKVLIEQMREQIQNIE